MRAMSNVPAASSRGPSSEIPERRILRKRAAPTVARVLAVGLLVLSIAAPASARDRSVALLAAGAAPVVAEIMQLDCSRIGADAVAGVLARVPAPRIVLLQGSVAFVTMEPFAQFLIGMGYPAERLRNPRDGAYSYGSFGDSAALAGELAFEYEQSGLEPMIIGHSQGGMLAIRTLYELAGAFHDTLQVVDPATGRPQSRTAIVDPLTGELRPVVGLHVAYVAALATGWLPRLLLGQWRMLPRLREIPDSVTEFTGFAIPHDPIAGNLFGVTSYRALGRARVRNVVLPSAYRHVALPDAAHLARDPAMRAWIDRWTPDGTQPSPAGDSANLVHAADIWYSVKRHWCLQAQRLLSGSVP
jgi:hypothetical protein